MSFTIDWWWPFQEEINSQFGFSKSREEVSSRLISRLYQPKGNLAKLLLNNTVTIVGAGITENDQIPEGTLIAADGAVSACLKRNLVPEIVIHGHGDNLSRLFEFSTKINPISLTTTYPSSKTNCWGGFTDGDRSLMMSLGLGAELVNLVGFNFEEIGEYTGNFSFKKLQKLSWARKIVNKCKEETGKVQIF